MTPETVAAIASGLVSLAARLSALDRSGPVLIATGLSPALGSALAGVFRVTRAVVGLVVVNSQYRTPLPQGVGEAAVLLAEASSQALRHISVALPDYAYQDRLQLSQASTVMHSVTCQFAGPLRSLVTYASLDDLYGATLSSNAMGGRPLSPLRSVNAFDALFRQDDAGLVSLTTSAVASARSLIGSDPVLLPFTVDTVAAYLSSISTGTSVTTS